MKHCRYSFDFILFNWIKSAPFLSAGLWQFSKNRIGEKLLLDCLVMCYRRCDTVEISCCAPRWKTKDSDDRVKYFWSAPRFYQKDFFETHWRSTICRWPKLPRHFPTYERHVSLSPRPPFCCKRKDTPIRGAMPITIRFFYQIKKNSNESNRKLKNYKVMALDWLHLIATI